MFVCANDLFCFIHVFVDLHLFILYLFVINIILYEASTRIPNKSGECPILY